MKPISSPKRNCVPSEGLWDWSNATIIKSYPSIRNYLGAFFEEATLALTGAARLKTEARKVCPDAMILGTLTFIEAKSVGRSLRSPVYVWRIEQYDQMLTQPGVKLYYIFWIHTYQFPHNGLPTPMTDLYTNVAQQVKSAVIVDAHTVHSTLLFETARLMAYRGTDRTASPSTGKLPAKTVTREMLTRWSSRLVEVKDMQVFGKQVHVTVYGDEIEGGQNG